MTVINQASSSTLPAFLVGEGFAPGPKMNAEIAQLLQLPEGEVPDFCNRADVTAEYLELQDRVPYVKPTAARRHVCIFDHAGQVCITKDFKKGSQALACALHFVLCSLQSELT